MVVGSKPRDELSTGAAAERKCCPLSLAARRDHPAMVRSATDIRRGWRLDSVAGTPRRRPPDETSSRKESVMHIEPRPERPQQEWKALLWDQIVPAHESDWSRQVAHRRMVLTNGVRLSATRGLLLITLAVMLGGLPSTSVWAWALLIPSAAQVSLELMLRPVVGVMNEREAIAQVRSRPGGWITVPSVRIQFWSYEKVQLNLTGVLGAVACVANVVAVLLYTGDSGPAWLRVACLAIALLYLNSGLLEPLLDATTYSPLQQLPRTLRRVRPVLWVLVLLLVAGGVVASQALAGPWAEGSFPYALAVCLLVYYPGLRCREYERDLSAAAHVVVEADQVRLGYVAQKTHDDLQPFKAPLLRVLDEANSLSPHQKMGLQNYVFDVEENYRRARSRDSQFGLGQSIQSRVRQVCASAGIAPSGRFDIDGRVDDYNYDFARLLTTTLVHNAIQAYQEDPFLEDPLVDVQMFLVDGMANLEVTDALGPVPDHLWNKAGGTTDHIRQMLVKRGGQLSQNSIENGVRKTVRATWNTHLQTIRTREPQPDDTE